MNFTVFLTIFFLSVTSYSEDSKSRGFLDFFANVFVNKEKSASDAKMSELKKCFENAENCNCDAISFGIEKTSKADLEMVELLYKENLSSFLKSCQTDQNILFGYYDSFPNKDFRYREYLFKNNIIEFRGGRVIVAGCEEKLQRYIEQIISVRLSLMQAQYEINNLAGRYNCNLQN